MAACEGGGAGLWLDALPKKGPGGTRLGGARGGADMRATVRLWMGVAPRRTTRLLPQGPAAAQSSF